MVSSGLITSGAAFPVILWTNVGLTALAFIVTLNIHPLVVYLVGLSATAASLVRRPTWQALAGVVLGIALIFFGLETMSGSAQPLVATPWFHDLLRQTVASPAVAFLVGVAVAALLQSNTAATLLIITLAGAGAFDLEPALMLIYGTNLGTIVLRLLLAAELRGTALQLVRFEDLFCLVSGVIMVALFYAEIPGGVPLVRAAITRISPDLKTRGSSNPSWACQMATSLPMPWARLRRRWMRARILERVMVWDQGTTGGGYSAEGGSVDVGSGPGNPGRWWWKTVAAAPFFLDERGVTGIEGERRNG